MDNRLREIRESCRVSITELSRRTGITRKTIYKIEAGGGLTARTMQKVADALGKTVPEIFF